MTEHQKVLLEVFAAVDAFCRKENISYVMLGGTMLGAYRHKGFIPWDDDIDIGMPRAEYERFLRLAADGIKEPYLLRHFSVEKQVPYAFAHVEHTKTTYIEARRSGAGYRGGVYVEIFPLDRAAESDWKRHLRAAQIKFQKKWLYALIMERNKTKKNPIKKLAIAAFRATGSIDSVVRRMDGLLQKDSIRMRKSRDRKASDKRSMRDVCLGNLLGHWGRRENVPASVMFPAEEYLFEGRKFFGVQSPDAYLKALYGADYMTPPPVSEREQGKHEAVEIDLGQPYSISVGKVSR